jgi:CheY-like chemotaxis protein
MRKPFVSVVLAFTAVSALSTNVLACGESVFRAGKGVHYRAFTAPIPGTVLVYARTDGERAVAESLRQAGHDVHVVGNDAELAMQMQQQAFDVVLAPYSLHETVVSTTAQAASRPDVIPVVEPDSSDIKVAKAEFDDVVVASEDVRKYLKAIHHSLKARGA